MKKSAQSPDDAFKLFSILYWTGILKGDWDPDEHPRLGGPPNAGRFASKPKEPKVPKPGWPSKELSQALREFVKRWAARSALGALGFEVGGPGGAVVGVLLDILKHAVTPTDLNGGERRLIDQYNAYYDPPKTLDELHAPPKENALGYDQHHIVEQNPSNVAKESIVKFGRELIDDPNNTVWVPRLKHEQITGEYNSQIDTPAGRQRLRDAINEDDFETQYEKGLEMLRKYGVLK